jgi:polyhydroxyalkanoate synthesis regulator phasin
MNPDTILQSLQKSFRTTLGAASFAVDLVQHPEQRDENLARLRTDLNQLIEEWAAKGEVTEQEARNFVESILNQPNNQSKQPGASSTASAPTTSPGVQADLKDLTAQIAAIRLELEKLREQDP